MLCWCVVGTGNIWALRFIQSKYFGFVHLQRLRKHGKSFASVMRNITNKGVTGAVVTGWSGFHVELFQYVDVAMVLKLCL